MLLSIFLFLSLAGIAEIGGGYLVWLYMRDDKSPLYLLAGAIVLILYGVIPTFQPETSFGKVYAAYGGVFIAPLYFMGLARRWLTSRYVRYHRRPYMPRRRVYHHVCATLTNYIVHTESDT